MNQADPMLDSDLRDAAIDGAPDGFSLAA